MVHSFNNSSSSSGSDISRLFHNHGDSKGGLGSSHSLVLESEKQGGIIVPKSPAATVTRVVGKNDEEKNRGEKALTALKSHCEAERRRRERINAHLETLRALLQPSTHKMDKATILARAISQVKELKKNALEASNGLLIPEDADEVEVEVELSDDDDDGSVTYKASICCDCRPETLSDLRHTVDALKLQMVRAEMSTLERRMKNVFVYACCKRGRTVNIVACEAIASRVNKALSSVLEKASFSLEYSLTAPPLPSIKKRRMCFLAASSTSSCNHDSCIY